MEGARPLENSNKKTQTLKIRYEKTEGVKESSSCVYAEVEVDSAEVDVFVENVHQERLRDADDPSAVERWTADETVREVLNKPEYNQAKKYLRHTAYVATPDGEASVVEASLASGGYLARAGGVDPADSWAGEMTIWDAINSLPARDKAVLVDVRLNGLTQVEAAAKYGVSQPRIQQLLARSIKRLEAILRLGL